MHITLITVGQLKNKALEELATTYIQRLGNRFYSHAIKDSTREKEEAQIEKFLSKHAEEAIFLLDEGGRLFDSVSFAKELEFLQSQGKHLIFVIAGAEGFSTTLKKKYQLLSLSPLTFIHEMAQVLLLEQLYRAETIMAGKPYHKE
jgi:23S rRNA (pseudouridine1915-N3)-methyltransferase